MDANKIYRKIMISLFVVGVIISLIVAINYNHKGTIIALDYHFNGVVDSVSYDIKGFATIIVKGSHYYLGDTSWDFDHDRIQKGDSIIKERNSMIIKLIKPNGRNYNRG